MMTLIKRGIAALIVLGMLAAGWVLYFANTPVHLPQTPYEFTLKHGSSLRAIARQFSAGGLISEPWSFIVLAKVLGKEGGIKAGNYQLDREITPFQLLQKITRGDVSQSEIVFIEGWNFSQMRKALDGNPAIRHDTAGLSDRELLDRLAVQEENAEGLFFPDTYYFSNGMSDLAVLKRAGLVRDRREGIWIYYAMQKTDTGLTRRLADYLKKEGVQQPLAVRDLKHLQKLASAGVICVPRPATRVPQH